MTGFDLGQGFLVCPVVGDFCIKLVDGISRLPRGRPGNYEKPLVRARQSRPRRHAAQKAEWMKRIGFLLLIGVIVGIAFSGAVYEVAEKTADANFCGSCHTMQPFVSTFENHVHGGNNKLGFQAKCNDCHLPHGGLADYLFVKAGASINDVWVETFDDTAKIDWSQKLKSPGRFVYDSGCLECHANLRDRSLSNPRAFLPHRMYFAGATLKTCADCHSDVGHKHLAEYITE